MISKFYNEIYKLKKLVRRGWILRDVPERQESDAEHVFSMFLLAMEIMSKNNLELDQLKVMKLIAFHELGEIDAGDITPVDNVSKAEKFEREYACIKRLATSCNMPEIEKLWLEFEENKTPEARFAKSIDKYDAVLQAELYAKEHNMPNLYKEFRNTSLAVVEDMEKYKY